MEASFEFIVVAFLRGTGGVVRVLLAIDRDGEQLFEGEPVVLVEHRPQGDPVQLRVEGPDAFDPALLDRLRSRAEDLAAIVDASLDERTGEFDGSRMLERSVRLVAPHDWFDM